jgi:hypothetical protein
LLFLFLLLHFPLRARNTQHIKLITTHPSQEKAEFEEEKAKLEKEKAELLKQLASFRSSTFSFSSFAFSSSNSAFSWDGCVVMCCM